MARLTIAVSIVLIITSPVFAQNLLINPGFDNADQLDGWTCATLNGQCSWSAQDRLDAPDSGSLQHDMAVSSNNTYMWSSQCVLIEAGQEYVASAWYYWPDDPDVSQQGTTRFSFWFYESAGCMGTSMAGPTETLDPVLDTWTHVQTEFTAAPTGFQSALVFIGTWQNVADEPVRARLDDLDFSTTTLFRDDFESGGTGAWTTTFP